MAIATAIMAIGIGLSAAGSIYSQQENASAQKKAQAVQSRQMELEGQRQSRQIYRDMLKAQAMSETSAAASGALDSSSLEGGLSQAANSGYQSQLALNENLTLGREMASIKRKQSSAQARGSLIQNIGAGLTSLGNANFTQSWSLSKLGIGK